MSQSKDVSNYRRNRKSDLVKVLGGKFQICGFNLFQDAIEFHHENPEEKEYGLSSGNCRKLENDLIEAKKCYLVCANCHRGIHAGFYSNPSHHVFDENLAKELIQKRDQLSIKTKKYCIDCGIEIDKGATRCEQCAHLFNRKVKERPTREELKNLIRNNSFVQIGKDYNVSDNAVRKWCKNYSLPFKKTEINNYTDEDWVLV